MSLNTPKHTEKCHCFCNKKLYFDKAITSHSSWTKSNECYCICCGKKNIFLVDYHEEIYSEGLI